MSVTNIDLEFYDRNIRTLGKETQTAWLSSKVILFNITPSITELGKNLILSGTSVILCDDGINISEIDVKTNFFFNVSELGKNKAKVIMDKLQKINKFVKISTLKEEDIMKLDCLSAGGFAACDWFHNYLKNRPKLEEFFMKNGIVCYYIDNKNTVGCFINNLLPKVPTREGSNISSVKVSSEIFLDSDDNSQKCDENPHNISNETKGKNVNNNSNSNVNNNFIDIDGEGDDENETNDTKQSVKYSISDEYLLISLKNKCKNLVVKGKMLNKRNVWHYAYLQNMSYEEDEDLMNAKEEVWKWRKEWKSNSDLLFYPTCCIIGGIVSQEWTKIIARIKKVSCECYCYETGKQLGYFTID